MAAPAVAVARVRVSGLACSPGGGAKVGVATFAVAGAVTVARSAAAAARAPAWWWWCAPPAAASGKLQRSGTAQTMSAGVSARGCLIPILVLLPSFLQPVAPRLPAGRRNASGDVALAGLHCAP